MSPVYDLTAQDRETGLEAAKAAIDDGKLIVLPTDTVYGIGADAFKAEAVAALLDAKGRGREMPPPVLVPNAATVDGLAMSVPSYARRLIEKFWPGGLTLIFRAQPSLMWDLGDTNGTVALRMPNDDSALALLEKTGPLAVSSANRTGQPTATTITEAGFAFGPAVEAYLDGGSRTGNEPSTILDCTKADPVMLRAGAVTVPELREVLGPIEVLDATGSPISEHPRPDESAADATMPDASATNPTTDDASAPEPSLADVAPEHVDQNEHVDQTSGTGSHAANVSPSNGDGVGAEPPFER